MIVVGDDTTVWCADAWLELAEQATRMLALLGALGECRPVPVSVLLGVRRLLGAADRSLVDLATSSVTDVAMQQFIDPRTHTAAVARAGFSGLPAWTAGTGAVFCLTPGGHCRRYARPIGGSAAFVGALVAVVTPVGGRIRTGDRVSSIVGRTDQGRQVRVVVTS